MTSLESLSGQSNSAPPAAGSRRNSIGALRLFLASLVIYTHAFYLGGFGTEWLSRWSHEAVTAGHFAVQCFFVLSGWLVATSWCRQPSPGRFLWNRGLRLAPALWVCLAVTAFVFTPLVWWHASSRTAFFNLEPSAWGYVWHNLVLPRSQIAIGPFPDSSVWPGDWNGSLWTLFYEGACYLIIGALGLAGLLTRWRVAGTFFIAGLLLLHIAVVTLPAGILPGVLSRVYDTPGKLLTLHFLAGSAWAVWPQAAAPLLRVNVLVPVAALLLLGLSWHYSVHLWLSPLLLPPVLLWLWHQPLLAGFEPWARGDYSYGVYLYGYPVQQLLAVLQVPQWGFGAYLGASFLLALACAVASWHLVEKPALSLKSFAWPRLIPSAAA